LSAALYKNDIYNV